MKSSFEKKSSAAGLLPTAMLLCGLISAAQPLSAQTESVPPLILNNPGLFEPRPQVLEDPRARLNIRTVQSPRVARAFQAGRTGIPNFGFTSSVYWLRFRLRNDTARPLWFLRIAYAPLDEIDLYTSAAGSVFQRVRRTGDTLPFSSRQVKHRTFLFRLNIAPGTEKTIYLRFRTQGTMQMPLEVLTPEAFAAADHEEQIAFGLYYGIFLILTLTNLILFFLVRERGYLFYLLYITGFGIFQMNLNGLAFEYLWPNLPWWNNLSLPLSIGWAFFWGIILTMELLDTRKLTPYLHTYLRILALPFIFLIVISFLPEVFSYYVRVNIGAFLMIIFGFSVLIAGGILTAKGHRPARYFVTAWIAFLTGIVLYAMKAFGILPSNFITENGMQLGSAVEMSLLSLGLADRINMINREKEEARRKVQEAQLRAARLQLELLKKHIHPHFLLNSINATTMWMREDPDSAARLLHSLADELQLVLEVSGNSVIQLNKELSLCRAHLEVMGLRRDCSYNLEIRGANGDEPVPPMLFHTLVENGITHGFREREKGRFILIKETSTARTRFILFNNGDNHDQNPPAPGTGTGMKYVRTRLEETWPGRWQLSSGPVTGGWRVIIDIMPQGASELPSRVSS